MKIKMWKFANEIFSTPSRVWRRKKCLMEAKKSPHSVYVRDAEKVVAKMKFFAKKMRKLKKWEKVECMWMLVVLIFSHRDIKAREKSSFSFRSHPAYT